MVYLTSEERCKVHDEILTLLDGTSQPEQQGSLETVCGSQSASTRPTSSSLLSSLLGEQYAEATGIGDTGVNSALTELNKYIADGMCDMGASPLQW